MLLLGLGGAVDAHSIGGRLLAPLIMLILSQIREIGQHLASLAAHLQVGNVSPQNTAGRSAPGPGPARSTARPAAGGPDCQASGAAARGPALQAARPALANHPPRQRPAAPGLSDAVDSARPYCSV